MPTPTPEPPPAHPGPVYVNLVTHVIHLDEACPRYQHSQYKSPLHTMPTGGGYTICTGCAQAAVDNLIVLLRP